MAMPSSSVSNLKTGATGPKISSWVKRIFVRGAGNHRGLEEGAAEFVALAAGHHLAALGDGVGDHVPRPFDGALVDQRALLHAVVKAVADLQLGGLLGKPRHEARHGCPPAR